MRIIDNKYDFYDFLQDPTDNHIVFDRRKSFYLTKEFLYDKIKLFKYRENGEDIHMVVHCGAAHWLILIKLNPDNGTYELQLLDYWKNHNKPNQLLKIDLLYFRYWTMSKHRAEDMRMAIDNNDIFTSLNVSHYIKYTDYKSTYKKEEYNIPILAPSGLANIINPMDMFCAIEEYFSIEKSKMETTEPKGVTDNDKIIMHGFDTKSSFRGENKM